jgi:hypothetical protein
MEQPTPGTKKANRSFNGPYLQNAAELRAQRYYNAENCIIFGAILIIAPFMVFYKANLDPYPITTTIMHGIMLVGCSLVGYGIGRRSA